MSRIFDTWLDRVTGEVIAEAHILQLRHAVYPLSEGFEPGGKRTSLTADGAKLIVFALENRRDGGPQVTDEQAGKGTRWLHANGRRLGLPQRFRTEWPVLYRLERCELVWQDRYWIRALFLPRYVAHYADGTTLSYLAAPWQSRFYDTKDHMEFGDYVEIKEAV